MRKRQWILCLLMSALIMLPACRAAEIEQEGLTVVATLFPQYDFARQILGDKGTVKLLLPPGTEAHSYDPTPQDMVTMEKASILIYTSDEMEPWAAKIIASGNLQNTRIVDASQNIVLMDEHEEDHGEEGHAHGEKDPHYWLDPNNAILMVDTSEDAVIEADANNAAYYQENAEELRRQLRQLDQDCRELAEELTNKTILCGGHFAFGYFAKQYGFTYRSPYKGFSADSEPTPQNIIELIQAMEETGSHAIFYEELIQPKVAEVLAKETGASMYLLHGAHNISKEELEKQLSYISIMEQNLQNLREGLTS